MPKFAVGQLVATPGAMDAFSPEEQVILLQRHKRGDWGDLDEEDKLANDRALQDGSRILSAYKLGDRNLWIITEAVDDDGRRSATTLLLPEEY